MTLKQQLFIQKYLEFRNATKAVLDVYDAKNRNSAGVIGSRLLKNVKVRKELDRILEAERDIPLSIATLLTQAIESNSMKEKIKAIQFVFRTYGF